MGALAVPTPSPLLANGELLYILCKQAQRSNVSVDSP